MRVDDLLSLQRDSKSVIHRDELLFQTVHQSTELWLKLVNHEAVEAAGMIAADQPLGAARLLGRSATGFRLITNQLDMLRHLAPADFHAFRRELGNGSGFESPGWRSIQHAGRTLDAEFTAYLGRHSIDLLELYRGSVDDPAYLLAEALVDFDEGVAVWRTVHYKIATRVIGHEVVGTKGTPVDILAKLIAHKFFPDLWTVRTRLTAAHPLGSHTPASDVG
ncbi:tryptophan 2,3-dioxygenase [Streptosporangium canum]|uniref:Tryptophan 2,3-dioxygenase n=2 Tax=Streptosporangium canum TaxID=324952 RepID=A0A1I3N0L6_9ACTN|nr:tryptophan 2,3-dioxygenase [Streptosporangium canum]